jgi:hypothetical protein
MLLKLSTPLRLTFLQISPTVCKYADRRWFLLGNPIVRRCQALVFFDWSELMKRTTLVLAAVALLLGGAKQAESSVITAMPGGTVVPFPRIGYQGPGPESFGPGITWSSTNATHHQGGSLFGYVGDYGFSGNGFWLPYDMAGLNDSTAEDGSTDTMTFAFSTPVAAVGGFLNYVPGSSNPTTIAVYDSDHDLIESYNLTFLTGGLRSQGEASLGSSVADSSASAAERHSSALLPKMRCRADAAPGQRAAAALPYVRPFRLVGLIAGAAAPCCTAIHITKDVMLVESDFLPALTGRYRHRIASMVPAGRGSYTGFSKISVNQPARCGV